MGNCFSDEAGRRTTLGGTAAAATSSASPNDVVNFFLKSRGHYSFYSQTELFRQNARTFSIKPKHPRVVVI